MVQSCSAVGCTNRYGKIKEDGKKLQFHRFPLKNPDLLKKWLIAMRRDSWEPSSSSVICAEHFLKENYRSTCQRYLKEDAVPSAFNFPGHLQRVINKRCIISKHPECLHNILPTGYKTIIKDFELGTDFNAFSCVLRLPIFKKEDSIQWLRKFEKKSKTSWRVDRTYKESTSKIIFKKDYHCEHNTRPRSGSTHREKHTSCPSKLAITINQSMKRSKDLYNTSHPCQVRIRFIHNHELTTYTESKKSKTSESSDEGLEDNFNEVKDDDQKNIASCLEELKFVFEDMVGKLSEKPSFYAGPINKFVTLYNNCETDSALVSALCNFGKYNENLCIENGKKLWRQREIQTESKFVGPRKIEMRKNIINNELSSENRHSDKKSKLECVLKKFRPIKKKTVTTQPFLIMLKNDSCKT